MLKSLCSMVYMSTGYLKEVDSFQQTVELLLLHIWDVLTFGQVYLVTTEVYTECKMINSLQFILFIQQRTVWNCHSHQP